MGNPYRIDLYHMGMAMGDHPQESLEITINTMGTLPGETPNCPCNSG